MIKNLISILRHFFGREQVEEYRKNSSSSLSSRPLKSHKKENVQVKKTINIITTQPIQEKSNLTSTQKIVSINKPEKTKNKHYSAIAKIDKNILMKKIKTNIFFLDQLLDVLENQIQYKSYYRKIREMKEQSEGCFKITFRMKEEAPYCQNTLKTILNHTNIISKLLDVK